jgi:hypothetical protein
MRRVSYEIKHVIPGPSSLAGATWWGPGWDMREEVSSLVWPLIGHIRAAADDEMRKHGMRRKWREW